MVVVLPAHTNNSKDLGDFRLSYVIFIFCQLKKFYLIQKTRATGFQYERDCTNSCQSNIAAIQDILGVQNESVFKAGSGMADKCTSVVANASAWTTEIVLDELEKRGQTLEN